MNRVYFEGNLSTHSLGPVDGAVGVSFLVGTPGETPETFASHVACRVGIGLLGPQLLGLPRMSGLPPRDSSKGITIICHRMVGVQLRNSLEHRSSLGPFFLSFQGFPRDVQGLRAVFPIDLSTSFAHRAQDGRC